MITPTVSTTQAHPSHAITVWLQRMPALGTPSVFPGPVKPLGTVQLSPLQRPRSSCALVIVVAISQGDTIMRIALVTGHVAPDATHPDHSADPRGQALRVASLAGTLADLGHQVTVYARKDSPSRPRSQSAGGVRF